MINHQNLALGSRLGVSSAHCCAPVIGPIVLPSGARSLNSMAPSIGAYAHLAPEASTIVESGRCGRFA